MVSVWVSLDGGQVMLDHDCFRVGEQVAINSLPDLATKSQQARVVWIIRNGNPFLWSHLLEDLRNIHRTPTTHSLSRFPETQP